MSQGTLKRHGRYKAIPAKLSINHRRTSGLCDLSLLKPVVGTSLVIQWLKLCAPNLGSLGSIPGQGTRFHMPQLRPDTAR